MSGALTAPTVHVVLLNWNQGALLADCLESLRRVERVSIRIVVVDNASWEPFDLEALSDHGRRFHLIRNGENRGFSGGNNPGIEWALADGASHVLLLNTDTEVDPGFLQPLIEAADSGPDVGGAGPLILFHGRPDRVWCAGGELDPVDGRPVHRGFDRPAATYLAEGVRDSYYVSGCCLLARADVWRRVGLLSDDFYFRWEDVEWSERARHLGYRHLHVPSSRVAHKTELRLNVASASSVGIYFETRNRLMWAARLAPAEHRRRCLSRAWRAAAVTLRDLLFRSAKLDLAAVRAVVTGVFDFLRGRAGPAPAWLAKRR